jgi:excisionase family DNA binding protein
MKTAAIIDTPDAVSAELDSMPHQGRLLRVREVCSLLSLSKSTVYRMVEQNQLPHIRIAGSLRFRQHSILQWLSGQEKLPLPADSVADKAG